MDLGPHGRIPERELKETASLSGGPGGQHANKTAAAATLIWSPLESDVLSAAATPLGSWSASHTGSANAVSSPCRSTITAASTRTDSPPALD